jgi:hypothetical protein
MTAKLGIAGDKNTKAKTLGIVAILQNKSTISYAKELFDEKTKTEKLS